MTVFDDLKPWHRIRQLIHQATRRVLTTILLTKLLWRPEPVVGSLGDPISLNTLPPPPPARYQPDLPEDLRIRGLDALSGFLHFLGS